MRDLGTEIREKNKTKTKHTFPQITLGLRNLDTPTSTRDRSAVRLCNSGAGHRQNKTRQFTTKNLQRRAKTTGDVVGI